MSTETITSENRLLIRRMVLGPGEATGWHTDLCHRFTVVVRGSLLRIEFAQDESVQVPVHAGLAQWDAPIAQVHQAINAGPGVYEEVVTFYLDAPGQEPQPAGELAR